MEGTVHTSVLGVGGSNGTAHRKLSFLKVNHIHFIFKVGMLPECRLLLTAGCSSNSCPLFPGPRLDCVPQFPLQGGAVTWLSSNQWDASSIICSELRLAPGEPPTFDAPSSHLDRKEHSGFGNCTLMEQQWGRSFAVGGQLPASHEHLCGASYQLQMSFYWVQPLGSGVCMLQQLMLPDTNIAVLIGKKQITRYGTVHTIWHHFIIFKAHVRMWKMFFWKAA